MRDGNSMYLAHTMPGLEQVSWLEVRRRLAGAHLEGYKTIRDRNGMVLFRYGGDPEDLLSLRTAEDVFLVVERVPQVAWGYEGLSQIYEALLRSRFLNPWLPGQRAATPRPRRQRSTFRVVTRMVGRSQPYRRKDLQQSIEKALAKGSGGRWRAVEEDGDLEIWANLIGLDLICALRLSDASMRHRSYKTVHIEASLRPSVAAAMVWLTVPEDDDVFLDPMCGAGTLLVERGTIARHRLLLGVDRASEALEAAVANIGPRHKPRQLFRADARGLPFQAESVTKVATNLPFGKRVGTHRGNVTLYRDAMREMNRVLVAGGRMVLLSSEVELVEESVREVEGLRIVRGYGVQLLGLSARVFVVEKR
jgi:tRNA (guanine6-N2)-methyltransferase